MIINNFEDDINSYRKTSYNTTKFEGIINILLLLILFKKHYFPILNVMRIIKSTCKPCKFIYSLNEARKYIYLNVK